MSANITRRRMLVGAAGAAGLWQFGCADRNTARSRVSIVRVPSYSQDVYEKVFRLVSEHGPDVRGKRVLLKPNLVEFDANTAINTDPRLVHATLEAFRRLGAAEVRIAEGPGHRRVTLDLADAAGYFNVIPGFENSFTDLNLDDVARVPLRKPDSRLEMLYLPKTALAADLIVSLPKMKTHHWVGATLAMKNFFGLVPGGVYGWPKNVLHWAGINECIADLHGLFPRAFAIVDGIVGMEGNGPIQGTPKPVGVIVGGSDLVAVDATCCRIMGIDPARIGYLKLAEDAGQTVESRVQQIGEAIGSVRTEFQLIPDFRSIRLRVT